MEFDARVLGWLRKAVPCVFALAICAGLFLPVYTDEVGWRFQERAAIDGVDKQFSDLCGPNTLAVPPWFMMPARYYSAFFNTMFPDPLFIRLSGILYALLWLALLLCLIRELTRDRPDRTDRAVLSVAGIGLLCLGTLPLLLVWSRPEQPILLALTAALIAAWKGIRGPEATPLRAWLVSSYIVVLATIGLSYHLKTVFLVPAFLACLFYASRGRGAVVPRLAAAAAFGAVLLSSLHYWLGRLQCPGDPVLRAASANNNLGANVVGSRNLAELVDALFQIAANGNLLRYFALAAPRPKPMAEWLAAGQVTDWQSYAWIGALILAWAAAGAFALWSLHAPAVRAWRQRRLDPRLVFAALLFAAVLGWGLTQSQRNVYEASFVLPLLMLTAIVAWSASGPHPHRLAPWLRRFAVAIGLCALVSPLAIAATFGPSIARANRHVAYIPGQRNSQPVFGYSQARPDIMAAARLCAIPEPASAKALMIDEVTYLAFMESRLPQHYLGILGLWRGKIDDPMAYLRSRGSDGVIIGCNRLPEHLRRLARQKGQFCCLPPSP